MATFPRQFGKVGPVPPLTLAMALPNRGFAVGQRVFIDPRKSLNLARQILSGQWD